MNHSNNSMQQMYSLKQKQAIFLWVIVSLTMFFITEGPSIFSIEGFMFIIFPGILAASLLGSLSIVLMSKLVKILVVDYHGNNNVKRSSYKLILPIIKWADIILYIIWPIILFKIFIN
jgi:hypothetical protein